MLAIRVCYLTGALLLLPLGTKEAKNITKSGAVVQRNKTKQTNVMSLLYSLLFVQLCNFATIKLTHTFCYEIVTY